MRIAVATTLAAWLGLALPVAAEPVGVWRPWDEASVTNAPASPPATPQATPPQATSLAASPEPSPAPAPLPLLRGAPPATDLDIIPPAPAPSPVAPNTFGRRTLVYVSRSGPAAYSHHDMPTSLVAGGVVGGVVAIERGARVARDHGLTEPAQAFAARLAGEIAARRSLFLAGPMVVEKDQRDLYTANTAGADYILNVFSQTYETRASLFAPDRYALHYFARYQLLDSRSRTVIAAGKCEVRPETNEDSPGRDELFAEGAARLKAMTARVAERCYGQMLAGLNRAF